MVDYWSSEEGAIVEGGLVVNCYADNAITEGCIVKWGTTGADKIAVDANATFGLGCGIALKAAAAAGDIIPVMFHGIVKIVLNETLAIGDFVVGSATSNQVCGIEAASSSQLKGVCGTTVIVLGMLLQGGGNDDEVLMLVSPH